MRLRTYKICYFTYTYLMKESTTITIESKLFQSSYSHFFLIFLIHILSLKKKKEKIHVLCFHVGLLLCGVLEITLLQFREDESVKHCISHNMTNFGKQIFQIILKFIYKLFIPQKSLIRSAALSFFTDILYVFLSYLIFSKSKNVVISRICKHKKNTTKFRILFAKNLLI